MILGEWYIVEKRGSNIEKIDWSDLNQISPNKLKTDRGATGNRRLRLS